MQVPALVHEIGPDPDDYCHDCETADALCMEPWCDDPRCRPRSGPPAPDRDPGGGLPAA